MGATARDPIIQYRPVLQRYYATLESRIGYWAFLGGRRHFGYYDEGTYWPFPITAALERMEEYLYKSLQLPHGSRVLDAGCGEGFVAIHMASRGLSVEGIDIVNHHIEGARRNVRLAGYEKAVTISFADYHHLEQYPDGSFDGVYVIETLSHSTDPQRVLSEFFRIIRPGGRLAMQEYEHVGEKSMTKKHLDNMRYINELGSMPALNQFETGVLKSIISKQGFRRVVSTDLTDNVRPLLRLFFIVAIIPYLFIYLFGLQSHFANATGAVAGYRADRKGYGRYTALTATKPLAKNGLDD